MWDTVIRSLIESLVKRVLRVLRDFITEQLQVPLWFLILQEEKRLKALEIGIEKQ